MKKLLPIFMLLSFVTVAQSQSSEVVNGDTLNRIDIAGKKQGKWILRGKHKPGTCYQPEQKIEEGKYQDNRKVGPWIEYYCNGNMKNKLTFVNGRPDGYAIMYHDNGKISEEGNWKINKWVGNYKLYYDNGQKAIEGNFANGKESGLIKEFYENGDVKAEKTYAEGNVDVASIKEFQPKKPITPKSENPLDNAPKVEVKPDEKPNDAVAKKGPVVLNGKYTLYNKSKQITKDGIFKDNRLMEGKAYIYDENGILTRVSVYKDGIYVGDTQIEN